MSIADKFAQRFGNNPSGTPQGSRPTWNSDPNEDGAQGSQQRTVAINPRGFGGPPRRGAGRRPDGDGGRGDRGQYTDVDHEEWDENNQPVDPAQSSPGYPAAPTPYSQPAAGNPFLAQPTAANPFEAAGNTGFSFLAAAQPSAADLALQQQQQQQQQQFA
eukprot:EG_transcript_36510